MHKHPRWFLAVLVALLAVLLAPVNPGETQVPSDISPVTDRVWDVGDADPNVGHTGQIRALVWDIEEYGGRVYVAGKFLNVYAPNGEIFPQPYLAAFDLQTGALVSEFLPRIRGPVYAIDITADGTIIAGGEIPGGLQAVNATTGADVPGFGTNLRHEWGQPTVFDLEVVGPKVYAGGQFVKSGGVPLEHLARFDVATGALDPAWRPTANFDTGTPLWAGSTVFGLAVDTARDRVYLAGKFGGINGDTSAAYLGIVDTVTGAIKPGLAQGMPPGVLSHRESFSNWQHDVQFHADRVYVGGQAHQTVILDANTMAPIRSFFTNTGFGQTGGGGDTQVIHVGRTTVWAGCHCWGAVAEYPIGSRNRRGQQTFAEYRSVLETLGQVPGTYGQRPVSAAYGLDIATGNRVDLNFAVNGQAGAWAMLEDSNGRLWMGGQFTQDKQRGVRLRGLARFSPPEMATEAFFPEPAPDPVPAATAADLRVQLNVPGTLILGWQPIAGAATYEVLRDGVVVGTGPNHWWKSTSPAPGAYTIRALSPAGTPGTESAPVTVK